MLRAIRTGEDAAAPRAGFSLLPLCRSGRVFLKLNTAGLHDLCLRAGISIPKADVLNLFDAKRLDRVLRRPTAASDHTVHLHLAGEFFRTDGMQAQFVCGTKRGEKPRPGRYQAHRTMGLGSFLWTRGKRELGRRAIGPEQADGQAGGPRSRPPRPRRARQGRHPVWN
jgi:hypothetical protein